MKRELLRLLALITIVSVPLSGCYPRRVVVVSETPGRVIVSETPPSPQQEVIGVAPSTAHVWVEGFWIYRDGRWVWIPGHWEVRPRAGALWVPGHWDHMRRGWVWTPGHWA